MTTPTRNFRYLRENPNNPHRLGRHQVHDVLDAAPERDLVHVVDLLRPIETVEHKELVPVFDQDHCNPDVIAELGGDPSIVALGDCTMNGAYGVLMTEPFHRSGWNFGEDDCVRGYHVETTLDDSQIPGQWPNDDTGSTGPWSMMVLEKAGLIKSWTHTRNLRVALGALNDGPISIGTVWFNSMFQTDEDGVIKVDPSSGVGGGHQYAVVANDVERRRVKIRQSWGESWGIEHGHGFLPWDALKVIWAQGGDAVQPRLA